MSEETTAPTGAGARHEHGALRGRPNQAPALHVCVDAPANASAYVLLLHGFGEHGGRYDHVVDAFVAQGMAVVRFDFRGHGRSEGVRGHCNEFADYLDDVADVLTHLDTQRTLGKLPVFGLGHSYGALIATAFALHEPARFRGLLLTSPFFGFANPLPWHRRLLGRVAERITPAMTFANGVRATDLTHDQAVVAAYANDDLVHRVATPRWYFETKGAQQSVMERAPHLRIPLFIAHAGDDRLASLGASHSFYVRCGSKERSWCEMPGLFHELLNEPTARGPLLQQMASWMQQRLDARV